mgnify:CR=1 FL=1
MGLCTSHMPCYCAVLCVCMCVCIRYSKDESLKVADDFTAFDVCITADPKNLEPYFKVRRCAGAVVEGLISLLSCAACALLRCACRLLSQ